MFLFLSYVFCYGIYEMFIIILFIIEFWEGYLLIGIIYICGIEVLCVIESIVF